MFSVELGQPAFIAVVLVAMAVGKRLRLPAVMTRYTAAGAPDALGTLSTFWFLERLSGFST